MATPKQITPCLWFDTDGEAAAKHYVDVFDNSRITQITHYGPDMPKPEGSVLTVAFELDGQPFIALNGGPEFTFSEAVSFEIGCESQDDVDYYWSRLSEGGEEGPCGWLKDKFGVSWQVVPTRLYELLSDPDAGRANRATQAMMGMKKLDIAELERAADG